MGALKNVRENRAHTQGLHSEIFLAFSFPEKDFPSFPLLSLALSIHSPHHSSGLVRRARFFMKSIFCFNFLATETMTKIRYSQSFSFLYLTTNAKEETYLKYMAAKSKKEHNLGLFICIAVA